MYNDLFSSPGTNFNASVLDSDFATIFFCSHRGVTAAKVFCNMFEWLVVMAVTTLRVD